MYAIGASAAGVGVLALAQTADAKIIYTPTHQVLLSRNSIVIDLNHDNTPDFAVSEHSTVFRGGINVCGNGSFGSYPCLGSQKGPNQVRGTGEFASALRAGVQISSYKRFRPAHLVMASWNCASSTSCRELDTRGLWNKKTKRYLGLRFLIQGKIHYGWARLNVNKYGTKAVLTGYAYETIPGKSIKAGQTKGGDEASPEIGTLGALARGAE
jgi:hypothetical protein